MSLKKNKNPKSLDTDAVIRELAERGGFTLSDTKIFVTCFEDLFADCVEQGIDIDLRGFIHLYIQEIKPFSGVNAHKSKLEGKTVYEDFPASKRAVVKLGMNMRDILREPGKRKIQKKH
jgi:hypothetical protein